MKQIICMKWGPLYGAEYVNRLYAMVRKNITGDIRFVCLTDDRAGIRDEVECFECPTVDIPSPKSNRGWRKLSLFAPSEKLFGFTDSWLYLDLDVVVTDSLDDFFTYKPELSYVVMKNWTQPGKNIGNTSVYRFHVGAHTFLLDDLERESAVILARSNNSQTYISRKIGDALHFWPDAWCQLFKVQCVPSWPVRFWKEPTIPQGCKVVAFPGVPNPHDAMDGQWPDKHGKKKLFGLKRLYKHIRPALWIKDIWLNAEKNLP